MLAQPLTLQEAKLKNPLSLAFVGDTVWDLLIRQQLLCSQAHVNALHKQAVSRVNAGAQAQAAAKIEPHLTEAEGDIFRRGQNAHSRHNTPKNQDPYAYSRATGLEALLGYLYLTGQTQRILDLFSLCQP
ncbi:MAG: ribonuclease III [Clostridia bacterium]|nr:ribonuclease III [Clostridia bacterium]